MSIKKLALTYSYLQETTKVSNQNLTIYVIQLRSNGKQLL
jgi:hypothetical protein